MTPSGSEWLFSPLYNLTNNPDGAYPYGRVIIGPDGALYSTTEKGGEGGGTVFRLAPLPTAPKNAFAPWSESILHAFKSSSQPAVEPTCYSALASAHLVIVVLGMMATILLWFRFQW
jgi:hypothetical protein